LKGGDLPENYIKELNLFQMALFSEPVVAYSIKNLLYSLIVDSATGNEKNKEA
jgi:hypothetical protein